MSNKFSPKKYFSKIHAVALLQELYTKHNEVMLLEISEQTPRKTAVDMMIESLTALAPENKIDIQKDLAYVAIFSTIHATSLIRKIFKSHFGKEFEPDIECVSDHDYALYFFLRHEDLVPELLFLHEFYLSKTYLRYEAAEYNKETLSFDMDELAREFKRIANKEDNATECEFTWKELGGICYVRAVFEGSYETQTKINPKTGEVDRSHTARKIETTRIALLPQQKLVLISGTGDKNQKLIFLDTFLRIICKTKGYEGKIETYNLDFFRNTDATFTSFQSGIPLMRWKIKNMTVSYKDGKKKLRLTLPSDVNTTAMSPLTETLSELGMTQAFSTFHIENVGLSFIFNNKEKEGKTVNVNCTLSHNKASLCPLFEYETFGEKLLEVAGIYEGFKLLEK